MVVLTDLKVLISRFQCCCELGVSLPVDSEGSWGDLSGERVDKRDEERDDEDRRSKGYLVGELFA